MIGAALLVAHINKPIWVAWKLLFAAIVFGLLWGWVGWWTSGLLISVIRKAEVRPSVELRESYQALESRGGGWRVLGVTPPQEFMRHRAVLRLVGAGVLLRLFGMGLWPTLFLTALMAFALALPVFSPVDRAAGNLGIYLLPWIYAAVLSARWSHFLREAGFTTENAGAR
jgi:hypothetical protein